MYSKTFRLISIIFSLIAGIWLLTIHNNFGYLFILWGLFGIFQHFRSGTVKIAFQSLQRGDIEMARKYFQQISSPEKLHPVNQAYYHWICGALAANANDLQKAKEEYLLAYEGHLRTENDMSILACILAQIEMKEGNLDRAKEFIGKAGALAHEPMVKGKIEELLLKLEKNKQGQT